jgi:hypothetical protein
LRGPCEIAFREPFSVDNRRKLPVASPPEDLPFSPSRVARELSLSALGRVSLQKPEESLFEGASFPLFFFEGVAGFPSSKLSIPRALETFDFDLKPAHFPIQTGSSILGALHEKPFCVTAATSCGPAVGAEHETFLLTLTVA